MFKLWCEYDYGQEDMLFTSEDQGKRWLMDAIVAIAGQSWLDEEFSEGVKTMFDEGLAGFTPQTVCQD